MVDRFRKLKPNADPQQVFPVAKLALEAHAFGNSK
jgi:hypothetical protein